MSDKDQPLEVELHGQTLSITVGVGALKSLLLAAYSPEKVESGAVSVPDEYALACMTIVELRRVVDGGPPLIARLLRSVAVSTGAVEFVPPEEGF